METTYMTKPDTSLREADWEQIFADFKVKMPEPNYAKLKALIAQELDKARIEGLLEGLQMVDDELGTDMSSQVKDYLKELKSNRAKGSRRG